MALLNILRYPDPRLNLVAKPVERVDGRIKQLVAGDFAVAIKQARITPFADAPALLASLQLECSLKEGGKGAMGFV